MTEIEDAILRNLLELENAIQTMATANPKPDLLPIFAQLDELTARLPRTTEPDLLHYMHKRSYEKARMLLQGRNAENTAGHC